MLPEVYRFFGSAVPELEYTGSHRGPSDEYKPESGPFAYCTSIRMVCEPRITLPSGGKLSPSAALVIESIASGLR